MEQTKAVFFDRDGVVNTRFLGNYVTKWDEFEFLPELGENLKAIKTKGYLTIIITNQRGVGAGRMTQENLDAVHSMMQEHLKTNFGVAFDDIFACTDADTSSPRRKPSPAMLLEAQVKWNIDLSNSWFVGDAPTDIEAGTRAGTKTAFLQNEHETAPKTATICINSLSELLSYL